MSKHITIKELREQLEAFERLGFGEAEVWFRDHNDIDHIMTDGILDHSDDKKNVVLG